LDFKDSIRQLGDRVSKLKDNILTEEATKNAFIMPFLQCLGYDVFNPLEVVPEYVTDIGTKKGEKIDYAILKDGVPIILIECKHWAQNLDLHDGQLLRYFHVSKAKFSILTNGITYRFYSDLVESNKMDEKPFLEFTINEIKDNQIDELKKFHKSYFDIDSIVNTASELKYTNELKQLISNEFSNPSEAFIKLLASQVYQGKITAKVLEQFATLTRKSLNQYVSDMITDRLKSALNKEAEIEIKENIDLQPVTDTTSESKIITTTEEMEAFYIVKSILRQKVDSNRIFYRDTQSYFSVLLDNNNRKAICRLYLGEKRKYLGLFDDSKKETKIEISALDDLFNYATQLSSTIDYFDKNQS
jgi:hypothetical protein